MTYSHNDPTDDCTAYERLADPGRRRMLGGVAGLGVDLALGGCKAESVAAAMSYTDTDGSFDHVLRTQVRNIVVIYAENRSFANLFGHFPGVQDSLGMISPESVIQLDRDGKTRLATLPAIWGGLVPDAQDIDGKRYLIEERDVLGLPNAPFLFRDAEGNPLSNRVITQDPWHRFYQNQMQINGGRNDQFVAWADAGALVMGYYRNSAETLRLWQMACQYTLCDNFFMGAFGGSWLNHIFLISAQVPFYPDVHASTATHLVCVLDGDDPTGTRLKLAPDSPLSALDGPPKFVNDGAFTPDGYAVNTMAPPYQPSEVPPSFNGDPKYADPNDPLVLRPQHYITIGDRLSEKGIDWAWYSGGWQRALGHVGVEIPDFQYHHQPFNYFARYAPGTEARRRHLRDAGLGNDRATNLLIADIDAGKLPAVTFYKPESTLNMHAGYADVASGDHHIANVIEHIRCGPHWKNVVIIVTHDENGGWWDPVSPPKGDRWGPGSRVPALVISPFAKKGYVDHTLYDTTSILRFISRVHALVPLDGVMARDLAFAARSAVPPGDMTNALDLR